MKHNTSLRDQHSRISLQNISARFAGDEDGTSSVGAVIWVPFFMAVIALGVDMSLMMLNRGDMWRVAGEASRQVAIGSIAEADVQQFVEDYAVRTHGYVASASSTADSVITTITVPISSVIFSGRLMNATGNISVAVAHPLDG